jgi:hypothetical protein
MNKTNYSVPKFKIVVKDEKYIVSNNVVHCFLTFKPFAGNSPFIKLATANQVMLGCHWAQRADLSPNRGNIFRFGNLCSVNDKYLYNPTDYEYHGQAVLKIGDENDLRLAKHIAYCKAFRRALSFTYQCYSSMYTKLCDYAGDVFFGQLEQIAQRAEEMDERIITAITPNQ